MNTVHEVVDHDPTVATYGTVDEVLFNAVAIANLVPVYAGLNVRTY